MSITFHHLPSSRPRAPVCNVVVGQPRKRQRLQQDREREQRRQVSSAHPSLLRRIRFKQTEPQATVQHRQSAHVKGIDADQVHTRGQREALLTASGTSIPSSAGVTGAQQALRSQHWPLLHPAGLLSSSTGGTGSTRMLRLSPTPWHSGPQLPNSFHASSAGGGLHGSKTRSRAQEQIRLVPSAVCTTFEPTPATSMRARPRSDRPRVR